jgi:hypothetical protein
LRVQSVCRNFLFRMKFKIGGSRVQYVQYVQKKIMFRTAMILSCRYTLISTGTCVVNVSKIDTL